MSSFSTHPGSQLTNTDVLYSAAFIASFALICMIVSITLICQLLIRPVDKIPTISTILIIFCVICSTLCEMADLSRHIICYILNKDLYFYPLNNIYGGADLLYYLGAISFYLIAVFRLQIHFHGTNYAMKYWVLSFFYILIAISFLLSIFYVTIVFMIPANDTASSNAYNYTFYVKWDTIPLIVMAIIDFVLNSSLLIAFVIKLKQLLTATLSEQDIYNLKIDKYCYLYNPSAKVLLIITRHSILFGLTIITNQLFYTELLIRMYIIPTTYDIHFSNFCFRALENTLNCIALFLSLQSNLGTYASLCGCCHMAIQNCFLRNIARKIGFEYNANIERYEKKRLLNKRQASILNTQTSMLSTTPNIQNINIIGDIHINVDKTNANPSSLSSNVTIQDT
eukprot:459441_1